MELKCLNELKLGQLYQKTKEEKFLEIIDTRISNLYENGDFENLSNEQLVLIIQKYDDKTCWQILYEKTKNCIRKVMNKKVHPFYKKNEYDDTFTVLKIGWTKSVNKYDIKKATADFIAFASTLMWQEYVNEILSRRTETKDGCSIITMPISSAISTTSEIEEADLYAVVKDENSELDAQRMEVKDLIDRKLKILQTYYPLSYEMIIKNIYQNKTQMEIARECNIKQSRVSRHIQLGKRFLRAKITDEEYFSCIK